MVLQYLLVSLEIFAFEREHRHKDLVLCSVIKGKEEGTVRKGEGKMVRVPCVADSSDEFLVSTGRRISASQSKQAEYRFQKKRVKEEKTQESGEA